MTRGQMDAFALLRKRYDAMDFPQLPLEQSLGHAEAKRLLHNAMCYLLDGDAFRKEGR